MGMFSELLGLFRAMADDFGNLLDPYPKKRRPSTWTPDDEPIQHDPSSYEPWDFLTKEQWQEIYDGKKPLEDFRTIHSWPPQLNENGVTNKEEGTAGEINEESREEQAGESNEQGGEQTANSEDAESGGAGNEPIDSYENSVSEPDISGDSGSSFDSESEECE